MNVTSKTYEVGREWEHCDYAKDEQERDYLMDEYRMAYGAGWEFLALKLPKKYWRERVDELGDGKW